MHRVNTAEPTHGERKAHLKRLACCAFFITATAHQALAQGEDAGAGAAAGQRDEGENVLPVVNPTRVNERGERLRLVVDNGPPANRIRILITADCYTERMPEDKLFRQHWNGVLSDIFSAEPLGSYRGFFNVYTLYTESPSAMPARPGAVGSAPSRYGTTQEDKERLGIKMGAVRTTAEEFLSADIIIVLINNGRGLSIVPDMGIIALGTQDSLSLAGYAMGRSMGGLAPEWGDRESEKDHAGELVVEPEFPNVTIETDPEKVKWRYWFPPEQIVRKNSTLPVGLWEGGYFRRRGVFRPSSSCRMRAIRSHFCPVCAEVLVTKILSSVRLLDGGRPGAPAEGETILVGTKPVSFGVRAIRSPGVRFASRWFVDDQENPAWRDKADVKIKGRMLAEGEHELRVEIRDVTGFVRKGADVIGVDSHSWQIEVSEKKRSKRR